MGKSKKKNADALPTTVPASDPLAAQHSYVERLKSSGDNFGLMVASAFVRGMRDIGYRHTGTALDEIIDNSFQAQASEVHVAFGYGRSETKPEMIAVIDNGHGMEKDMVRASVRWGGTHRENDRSGWGRYGYGMKSSAVSQGKRFTVYSRRAGEELHAVTIDLDDIAAGKYNDAKGEIRVPEAKNADLPRWVLDYLEKHTGSRGFAHGTVVVLEKLDRLSFKTTERLKIMMFDHFGVTYRNVLLNQTLYVEGKRVQPIDPLFITPGMWMYDLDDDRAVAFEPEQIEVKDKETGESAGVIHVRYSYMPATFPAKDKARMGRPHNGRMNVMKAHRGIIVMRNGRQIDVVDSKCPWTTFVNYDWYWGIEIDFPATLDEEFSITTAKQQVTLSERIWDILEQAGVRTMIKTLRKQFREDRAKLMAAQDADADKKRASEEAMENASKFRRRRQQSAEQDAKNREKVKKEAERRAEQTGKSAEDAERELIAELERRPYKVQLESAPGGVFFRVEKLGGQLTLFLNTGHRFYTDLYAGRGADAWTRAGLEILLFTMGEAEVYADGDRRLFYETERSVWSHDLNISLDRLNEIDNVEDALSAADVAADDEAPVENSAIFA